MKDDEQCSAQTVHTETDQKDREVTTEEFLDFCENLLAELGYPVREQEKAPKVHH